MSGNKTVTINGYEYDSTTGLPVRKSATKPKTVNNVRAIDSVTQRTRGLNLRNENIMVSDIKPSRRKITTGKPGDVSKNISHFAPRTTLIPQKVKPINTRMDIQPIKHPIALKAERTRQAAAKAAPRATIQKSSKQIKHDSIAEALSKPAALPEKKKGFLRRNFKFINIFSISIILLLAIGYLIYLNMPSISVRIASAQAGINATYPEYCPDGYSISGPVVYTNHEVTINFHANTGNSKFIIQQSKSTWDSSAVKIQVDKESNNESVETKEGGLTIYTYNNSNAAWVNGGILYTITGDAKLSSEQIRHIATSL